jgi:hypothetical protein
VSGSRGKFADGEGLAPALSPRILALNAPTLRRQSLQAWELMVHGKEERLLTSLANGDTASIPIKGDPRSRSRP